MFERSKVLPDAWPGVLCDFSPGDPFAGGRLLPHPVRADGKVTHVKFSSFTHGQRLTSLQVALLWLYSKYVVDETVSGVVENHNHTGFADKAECSVKSVNDSLAYDMFTDLTEPS